MSVAKQSQRHPDFYYPDGSIILEICEDQQSSTLYRLHTGLLVRRSEFFKSLFSLPRGPELVHHNPDINSEGRHDENPVVLPLQITKSDFDHLLTYLFCGQCQYPSSQEFLVAVLNLSTFFEIADGQAFAIRELEKREDFHPTLRIKLARFYRVDSWIDPGFRELMRLPILSLTPVDVDSIGPFCFRLLAQTKAKIEAIRKQLAFSAPPAVNDVDCESPTRCCLAWSNEWWNGLARHILHPEEEEALSGREVLVALESVRIPGMCDPCQNASVSWVKASKGFLKEETILDEAVGQLMNWQTDVLTGQALLQTDAEST